MKPILGITMGDPSGNGPEISVKALMDPKIYDKCRPVIVGDAECLREAVKVVEGAGALTVHPIRNVKDAVFSFGTIDVLDMGVVDLSRRYYRKDRKNVAGMLGKKKRKPYTGKATECAEKRRSSM